MIKYIYEAQNTEYTCVPAVLKMVVDYYIPGIEITQEDITSFCKTKKTGTSYINIKEFLTAMGLQTVKIEEKDINLHIKQYPITISYISDKDSYHYSLIKKITKEGPYNANIIHLIDPYFGKYIKMPQMTLEVLGSEYEIIVPL